MLALSAIALGLRLSQLHQSLYGDELFTYSDIHGHGPVAVVRAVRTGGENSPPLFFLLAWISGKLGDPRVWIRVPSVLLGTITVPLVYALGRETVGRAAALIGAAIVALSPFTLFYGVEARPYATMTFFVVLSTLALVKAVATRRHVWWLMYGLSAIAAAYTHYTSLFVLAFQAIWSLWMSRDRLREPLVINSLVAFLYLPWLVHVHGKQLNVIALFQPLNASRVLGDLAKTAAGYPYASPGQIPGAPALAVIGVCVVLGIAGAVIRWRRTVRPVQEHGRGPFLVLIGGLAAATPVGLLLYTLFVTDIFQPRGLVASLPAAALLLAAALAGLPRPLTTVTAVGVLASLVVGTTRSVGDAYRRAPIKDAARFIDARGPADAAIAYYPYLGLLGPVAAPLGADLSLYLSRHRPLAIFPSHRRVAEIWHRFADVIVVEPIVSVFGKRIPFGPPPPPFQHRHVLASSKFEGLQTYIVTLYGPPTLKP